MPLMTSGSRLIRHKVTSFAPSDLANLAIWLKADAITGLADDAFVATWTDSSGSGRNATQAGADSLKPKYKTGIINGLPVVRFDGGDYLSHSLIASDPIALTMFIVGKKSSGVGSMIPWSHRSATTNLIQITCENNTDIVFQLRGSGNSIQQPTITGKTTTNASIITARFNKTGNLHQVWFNGGSVATNTTDFTGQNFIASLETVGATNSGSYVAFYNGDIGEIIGYSVAVSDIDRGKVESYLAAKWGITLA